MHRALVVLVLAGGLAHAGPPRVGHGEPMVQGKLAAALVVRTLKKTDAKLLACYKKALANPAVKSGTTTASFTIQPDGTLADVLVSSTGLTPDVDTCLVGVVSKLKFRKQPTSIVVMYPLTFASGRPTVGPPPGSGYGVGSDGKRAPNQKRPQVKLGLPTIKGDLDKAIVERYVKQNIQKFTYCYEKQLLVDAKLAGTVTATFTIDAAGGVPTAKASGMDENVGACLETMLTRISFPKPKTEITVSYPITFGAVVEPPKKSKARAKKR